MRLLKYLGLVALVMVLAFGIEFGRMALERHDARRTTMTYVYNICNAARQEDNGRSEADCGEVQDRTDTEFMCEQDNNDPATHCWVEDKR